MAADLEGLAAEALRLLVDFLAQRFGGDEAVWDKGLGEDGVAPR